VVLARVPPRWGAAYVALWVGLGAAELWSSAEALRKNGNARIAAALERHGCRTIVATGLAYASVRYAVLARGADAEVIAFPRDVALHPGNFDRRAYAPAALAGEARAIARVPGLCLLIEVADYTAPLREAPDRAQRSEGGLRTSLLAQPYELVSWE
jgi:hypothetical protein